MPVIGPQPAETSALPIRWRRRCVTELGNKALRKRHSYYLKEASPPDGSGKSLAIRSRASPLVVILPSNPASREGCQNGSEKAPRLVSHCNQVRSSQDRLNVPEGSDILRHGHSRLFSVTLSHHEEQTFQGQLPETCHYLAWPLHQVSCKQCQGLPDFNPLAQEIFRVRFYERESFHYVEELFISERISQCKKIDNPCIELVLQEQVFPPREVLSPPPRQVLSPWN